MYDFNVRVADNLEQALELKAEMQDKLTILAGGTDLLVAYRLGKHRHLKDVLDITHIDELRKIWLDDQGLHIGALATHTDVMESPVVQEYFPALADSLKIIGSIQIRNLGTVVGNVCNASPGGDSLPILYCANALVTVRSKQSTASIPLDEFLTGPGQKTLANDALVTHLTVPTEVRNFVGKHLTLRQRTPLSINKVSVALLMSFREDQRTVDEVRVSLGAVAPTVVRVAPAEAFLRGKVIDESTITQFAQLCAEAAKPITDVRSNAEYRKAMVEVLAGRILRLVTGEESVLDLVH